MKRVLFICTHNSARSQMAEALVNHDLAGRMQAFSAGTEPSAVHPLAGSGHGRDWRLTSPARGPRALTNSPIRSSIML